MAGVFTVGHTSTASGDRAPPTILVVDDEDDIRRALKDILEAILQANVLTARSGTEGLDVLRGHDRVNLILTDFKMPGMNGVEFLRQARYDNPGIPAVLITAFERELMDSLDANRLADTVLTKPISPRVMIQLVQRILQEQNT